MGLIAKIAQGIITGAKIFTGFAPLAELAAPKYAGAIQTAEVDFSTLANYVVQVEAIAGNLKNAGTSLTSAQKLQMLTVLVQQGMATTNLVRGKKIADPALLSKGYSEIAQGIFDVVDSFHEDVADGVTADAIKT